VTTDALNDLICQAKRELTFEHACEDGHTWEQVGGRSCPMGAEGCSQAVYQCQVCGEQDYGDSVDSPGKKDCQIQCGQDMKGWKGGDLDPNGVRNNTIAIQLNYTKEGELLEHRAALKSLGIEPIYYGLIPFSTEVTAAEEFEQYDKVIPFGSIKLIKLWLSGHFPLNVKIFYDVERFDQRYYGPKLGKLLLNYDAKYSTLGKVGDITVSTPMFIKPTSDLKAFAGLIVEREQTPREAIYSVQVDSSLTDNESILIAPLKDIEKEYRCFVVDDALVSASGYKVGSKVQYAATTPDETEQLQVFLHQVQRKYTPAQAYVVDFALLANGEMKVIEYNCIHCAGMCAVDRKLVFKALMETL